MIFCRPLAVLQEFRDDAPSSIDPTAFLHEQLVQARPDLLRQMLTTFIDALMSAEADAVCAGSGLEYLAGIEDAVRVEPGLDRGMHGEDRRR